MNVSEDIDKTYHGLLRGYSFDKVYNPYKDRSKSAPDDRNKIFKNKSTLYISYGNSKSNDCKLFPFRCSYITTSCLSFEDSRFINRNSFFKKYEKKIKNKISTVLNRKVNTQNSVIYTMLNGNGERTGWITVGTGTQLGFDPMDFIVYGD